MVASLIRAALTSLLPAERSRRLISRFALLASAQVIGSALSFLTAVIITRVSGAEVFGQITVGMAVLAYALHLTNFGTDVSAVKAAAGAPQMIGQLLPAIYLLRLFWATLAFVLVLLLSPVLAPEPQARLVLIVIVSSVFAAACLPAWLPQSQEDIKATALATFGPFAITFALTILAALTKPNGLTFAFSRLGGDAVVAACLSAWAWRYRTKILWSQVRSQIRALIHQSGSIVATKLVRGLAFLTDVLIVSFFFNDATVGQFSAAYRIYLLLISVYAMFFIIYFPRLVRAANMGRGPLSRELSQTFRWSFSGACLVATMVILVAPWFLPFAFGAEFSAAVPALQILVVAAVLNFVHRNYSRALVALGYPQLEFVATAIATVVGIGFKLVGASQWGIAGAASAIVLGEVVLLVLLRAYIRAKLRNEPSS